jgi:uncharacterized protein (TIGR02611 family)
VGVVDRIERFRNDQVVGRIDSILDDGESVLEWARARHPEERRDGFVYITEQRVIVDWSGGEADGRHVVVWEEIASWGVDPDAEGGPLLGIEHSDGGVIVRLPVHNRKRVDKVKTLIRNFAHRAPEPRRPLSSVSDIGTFHARGDVNVTRQKPSVAHRTRRIVLSVIGIVLVIIGLILAAPLVPGPGFLVIIAGLALLSTQYDWAQDVLTWAKEKSKETADRLRSRRT